MWPKQFYVQPVDLRFSPEWVDSEVLISRKPRGDCFTSVLRLDEREQLFVDLVFKRRAHAVRRALVHL